MASVADADPLRGRRPSPWPTTARATTTAMTTDAIAAGTACVWKTSRLGRVLRLGEHDREQDQDADRADVDDDLGGRDERRAEDHVDAGQGAEAHDHRQAAADDVAHRHDQQARRRA